MAKAKINEVGFQAEGYSWKNFKPAKGYVLFKLNTVEKQYTDTGLYKADETVQREMQERNAYVQVLKVGDDVTLCKPGDFILIHPQMMANVFEMPKEGEFRSALVMEGGIFGVYEQAESEE